MKRRYRIAYLVSHPIQYQAPMLRYIAKDPTIDLKVFFLSDFSLREYHDPGFGGPVRWDVPLLEGYDHAFLSGVGRTHRLSFWTPFAYGLWHHFKQGRFDALWVHGYAHQACLGAVFVAKALGLPVLLRGDSHLRAPRSRLRAMVKAVVVPGLFRVIDAFLAIGTLNREYYRHYGVPEKRLFMMPYAVDNAFFQARIAEVHAYRERLRAELRLEPERPVILYASKFEPGKRAGDLLEAYVQLSEDGARARTPYLLFIGDGVERVKLEARVRRLSLSGVKFLGFKGQTELPQYYDLCDVFVLPSERDAWGLVVNEVMNAGKPVVVSDQVGAGPDLVLDGKNGFVTPVGDIHMLTDRLMRLTTDRELARRMGEESFRRVNQWNFESDLQGLLEALGKVVAPVSHVGVKTSLGQIG